DAMAVYTLSGSAGHLFDAKKDGLEDSLVCGFEIAELMGMGERIVIPFLSYAFRRFARMLKGQPAYLLIDEAWTMLGHPVWRDKLREWLKELRKATAPLSWPRNRWMTPCALACSVSCWNPAPRVFTAPIPPL